MKSNEEKLKQTFFINFLGFNLCCFKKKYRNNEKIRKEIENIEKEKKEKIEDKLLKIRDEYMKENRHEIMDIFTKISKKIWVFILISFFHFLAMTEVEGILFSIFGEIRRQIDIEYTNKTFYDFLGNSTFNDSAQINFNYFFSFFSSYFINNNKINKTYIISTIIILILFLITSSFDFSKNKELNNKIDWGNISILAIIYLIIYFCASLISLLPHKLLKKEKNF